MAALLINAGISQPCIYNFDHDETYSSRVSRSANKDVKAVRGGPIDCELCQEQEARWRVIPDGGAYGLDADEQK